MLIDPTITWRLAESRLAAETEPRRRAILTTMIAHMRAEAAADVDAIMATVSPNASYRNLGASPVDRAPKNPAEIRAFYQRLADGDCYRQALDVDTITLDSDTAFIQGHMRMAYPGRIVALMGRDVDDPDAYYLYESRMAIFWAFDADGLVSAEDTYPTGDGLAGLRKLAAEEVPPAPSAAYLTSQ